MAKYWRLIGEYDSETTAYTSCVGASQTSPYTPDMSGKLTGLRVIPNRSAASSLVNHVQFRLTSTTFKPNTIHVGGQGTGLQTAPALQQDVQDYDIDQAVVAGVPITVEARNVTADTPVTVSVLLYGRFEG